MTLTTQGQLSLRAALKNSGALSEIRNVLNMGSEDVKTVAYTVGTEDGNSSIAVAIQLKDPQGNALAERRIVPMHVLNGNLTAWNTGTLTFAGVTGDIAANLANKQYDVLTTGAGSASFTIVASGASTVQLVVPTTDGWSASGNITHAS